MQSTTADPAAMDFDFDVDMDTGNYALPESSVTPAVNTFAPDVSGGAGLPEGTTVAAPSTEEKEQKEKGQDQPQYEKVHIRGLDELTTDDIMGFVKQHYREEAPIRIEWVDDTSANIVFTSAETGLRAQTALLQDSTTILIPGEGNNDFTSPFVLRPAKKLETRLEAELQVRTATSSDKKRLRAYEASRFYLMHPEHDPREKKNQEVLQRKYNNKTRYNAREDQKRRTLAKEQGYTESMYDDNYDTSGKTGHGKEQGRAHGRELFPEDTSRTSRGRLNNQARNRDRSASPSARRRDSDIGSRRRSRSPRGNRQRHTARGKELFPESSDSKGSLFSRITPAEKSSRSSDNTTNNSLFARASKAPSDKDKKSTKASNDKSSIELFPDGESSGDSLFKSKVAIRGTASDNTGMSIRGMGHGLAIKGSAQSVKELFPSKYDTSEGRLSFSDKLEGRSVRRRRAEDMFH